MGGDDVAFLRELAAGDRATALEILNYFIESDAQDRRALAAAVAARQADDIRLHAHRIKGAARAIGANAYAECAASIETAAANGGDLTATAAALDESARAVAAWTSQLQ